MNDAPQFRPESRFEVNHGCLMVGGKEITRLVERVGGTPFYAYDRRMLTQRVQDLWTSLPAGVHVHYAMKANPMDAVVQHMARIVDGIDVASLGEMKIALDSPVNPENVSIAGPGKRPDELRAAIAAGILINVESPLELERIAAEAERLGIAPRLALRINPSFELKSAGMKMGGGAKPFGIDEDAIPQVFQRVKALDLRLEGFQVYAGSQNLNAASLVEAHQHSVELLLRLSEQAPGPIDKLNIGGGFGIPYFRGEQPLDLRRVGEGLQSRMEQVEQRLPGAHLILELGRYLVGEAGIYVCRVTDRKVSQGQVFLVTDGGMHHHLAASGNFGQVIRRNFPVQIGNRIGSRQREVVSIVGPLCTPLDMIADKIELPRADVGDLVVVFQSGAYGLNASPTAFLHHPLAAEVLV